MPAAFVNDNRGVTIGIELLRDLLLRRGENLLFNVLSLAVLFVQKFGGHEMAAGLTVRAADVDLLKKEFCRVARELLSDDDLRPRLRLDHEIAFSELNFDFLGWHEMLQPFGNGNPQPLFFARGVESAAAPRVVGEKHLQLRLRQQNYHHRAIFFGGAAEPLPSPPWDIAFRIRPDEYKGETRLEMRVEAVRESAPTT